MSESAFDVNALLGVPRLSDLRLSPDGARLVVAVSSLDEEGKRFRSALWEIDPSGGREARRLTRSPKGESSPCFLPSGDLLFTSARPLPGEKDGDEDEETARLWLLPEAGGEARLLVDPPAGVGDLTVARDEGSLVLGVGLHPHAEGWDDDRERARVRKDAEVSAVFVDGYPIRHWDHWLAPRRRRLWAAPRPDDGAQPAVRDLTGDVGIALEEASYDLTPDGSTVVASWRRTSGPLRDRLADLVAIDVATGERRTLCSDPDQVYEQVACAPDGRRAAAVREFAGGESAPIDAVLVVVDLETGREEEPAPNLDLWPRQPVWAHDSSAVFITPDEGGHAPILRVEVATGEVTRLTAAGAYADVCPSRDGTALYALRSDVDRPHRPVRLDPTTPDQDPTDLLSPATDARVPTTTERVRATAADGTEIPSWLVLPPGASATTPAPLVLFIHGGPFASWNGWHWRWNAHVLASAGYAVLCPDPGLSTGYGREIVGRGWGRWGDEPYTDLLAAVDAVLERGDLDPERTAAMGGSFGGYMANWIAGHTDRFRCIITHASIWNQLSMRRTSDLVAIWDDRELGRPEEHPERYAAISPEGHAVAITTPMLVIHGERDYRVPVSEGLQLWTDLVDHGVEARFLYFPDENHWVLKPRNARLWYETVLAFLDHHVRDRPWERPELL